MDSKYVLPFLAACILTAAGCATTNPDAGWPAERPLADDLPTYQPPADPPGTDAPAYSAKADSLTLRMALSRALMQNPELQAFAFEVRAREAERVQAGRWPNPTLALESEDLPTTSPLGGFSGAEQASRFRQEIEVGGEPADREAVAAARRDLAGWDFERQRLSVAYEVRSTFASVLAAQRRLALAGDLVALAGELYETVQEQVEVGEVSPVELERVEVERAQARIELQQAEETLQARRHELAATWGAEAAAFEGVRGDLEETRPVPPLEAVRPLVRQNPRLARFADKMAQREAQIDLEQARFWPDPQLTAGAQRFGGRGEEAFTVGLALPIPLFDRNQGAIEAARYRRAETRRARQEAQAEVLADLEEAYRRLAAASAEVAGLREEVLPSARSAYEAYREGYRLGKFDLLRVLDAQETLFEAQLQEVRALRRYHRSAADVERITATPLDAGTGDE